SYDDAKKSRDGDVRRNRDEKSDALGFRDALREVGCPASLGYALVDLFKDFLACIDDPPRCVAVADFYESFAALNTLIRDSWPRYFKGLSDDLVRQREQARLFEKSSFRPFVDALQNSFALRLQRAIPHREVSDTA